jgi:hypothetical protein
MNCAVRILDTEIDGALTAAFHNPHLWFCGQSLTQPHFELVNYHDSTPPRTGRALYMVELFDRGRARWVLVIAVLLALLSGFVAGLTCHSVNVGLAVSSGVSAWISCAEFLLVWQYR